MTRSFAQRVLVFAFVYYAFFLLLDGAIFLLSHVPPSAVNLDGVILFLGDAEEFLALPRVLLRRLWPGESTPTALNFVLTFVNCILWGLVLASVKSLWENLRR